ncbi:response regulator transcription factor [Micromonospora purpureochromogenes]|uniref:Two-component system response regulator DesR n=1 Tax=Micromonospora purpureochromogenes TaxID=47872 RepID=A0ABX2RW12_9ACTN|nr:response regulator transcription factor [Micromonospora purpureochromogenes]NYF59398.1 two-component system response regulator DesR [Micromonospora purpureochromogenes]
MVRTLLALKGALVRGALAQLLAAEDDIDVVGEADTPDELRSALRAERPDVAVVDGDLVTADQLGDLASDRPAGCPDGGPPGRLLVLVQQRRAARLGPVLAQHSRRIGFLSHDVAPGRIVEGVRQLADGRVVLDPDLVVAALAVADSPLTPREREVLDVAAEGHPVRDIAERLVLSAGTVRNHLSRIMAKTGARTRLEAVRIARESGWI